MTASNHLSRLLDGNSAEAILLTLLVYQKRLSLEEHSFYPRTPYPFEKVVLRKHEKLLNRLDSGTLANLMDGLMQNGLVECLSTGEFTLSAWGRAWSSAIIEYEVQVAERYIEEALRFTKIEETVSEADTLSILDVGCGTGVSAIALSKALETSYGLRRNFALHYQGVDLSWEMLEVAKLIRPSSRFIRGHALSLPFTDSVFDLILSKGVALYFDLYAFLRESLRVLRPKGRLVLIAPSLYFWIKSMLFQLKQGSFMDALKHFLPLANGGLQLLGRRPLNLKGSSLTGLTKMAAKRAVRALGGKLEFAGYAELPYTTEPVLVLSVLKESK